MKWKVASDMNFCLKFHYPTILGLLIMLAPPGLGAETVFHWVDEDGVKHYSQNRPPKSTQGVELIDLVEGGQTDNGIGISEADDPEGYAAHRENMDELWAGIEARREEVQKRESAQPTTEVVFHHVDDEFSYPLAFPPYPVRPGHRPPHRPGHRPGPEPPVEPPDSPPSYPYKRP